VIQGRAFRVAEFGAYRFWVNVAEPLGVEPYFFRNPGTAWIVPTLVRPGDLCLDVGANAGHYTFLCASLVGPAGRVLAFEPNPEFAAIIKKSIDLNGYGDRAEIREVALSATTGAGASFHVSDESSNSGTSSLVDHGAFSASHLIRVDTITLDSVVSEVPEQRARLVKVDVERAEDEVFEGAKRVLSEQLVDFFIVELVRGSRAERLLLSAGYACHWLDHRQKVLVPLSDVPQGHFGDFLFSLPVELADLPVGLVGPQRSGP
jgi:FkbM family methyltransferase